ncbi:hypothetical protein AMATHDRAFT_73111 [Amanita thiersii Skay4041]|uniref:NAD(P)-binding protein n=1 Tax=Amanita thiersii Skay4041 TaxID=703135 RepID=A0A2A9P0N0_9AGAR|nr:hypothetical protein AMATHDRAFT_73111 [Amanita thiersii Skay4041]
MGILLSLVQQCLPPQSCFSADDIGDLTGKVVIVTGANTGVGKETVRVLLLHNAKVYLAARNAEKAERAILDLKQQTGNEAHFLKCDLADLNSIKTAVKEFTSKENELHILFNNAGVMSPPIDELTAQGYDLEFGTNVLGHFYLTKLLLPTLISTAKTTKVRVVTSSSVIHYIGSLDFDTFRDSPARRRTKFPFLYAQSKFGNLVYATELARRYGDQGIISIAVNPGNIRTDLVRNLPGFLQFIGFYACYPVSMGALTQLYAATSKEAEHLNGKFLVPWARVADPKPAALDPQLGRDLWEWCEEQVKNI